MHQLLQHITLPPTPAHDAQRLFHGRGHAFSGYEHITIDWLSPVVLITLYREEDQERLHVLATLLISHIDGCCSVQVQYRCRQRAPFELLRGEPFHEIIVKEQGLNFHISLGKQQNTGLFLDMQLGRRWVREHAVDKNVLNLFAYTCGFSVAAIAGGARNVVNFDMSRPSLTTGRENHRLNRHETSRIVFEGVDIFRSFSRIKKHGPYDLLICDPPTYQKGSVDIEQDYKKIVRRIPQFMHAGAQLLLCLNSPDLDENFLIDTVAQECPECEYLYPIDTPAVFVEAVAGKGLKALVFHFKPQTEDNSGYESPE